MLSRKTPRYLNLLTRSKRVLLIVLPKIIHSSQTGYVKGKYIGESIRTITDIMSFTKRQNIPGLAFFPDFETAFDSIEWNLQKCLETFNFGPQLRQWISVIYSEVSSCILNHGFATKQLNLEGESGKAVLCLVSCLLLG